MPVQQKFIDVQAEPFDGCLIILNLGNDNYRTVGMSKEYETSLTDAIKQAHAAGHAVLYLGDALHGTQGPPEDFPVLDGADVPRLMSQATGLQLAEFPSNPNLRMQCFAGIAQAIFNNASRGILLPLCFRKDSYSIGKWRITGSCKIDGVQVLHPVTTISPLRL